MTGSQQATLSQSLIEKTPLIRRRFSLRYLGAFSSGRQKYGNRTMADLPCGIFCWRDQEAKNHDQVDAQR